MFSKKLFQNQTLLNYPNAPYQHNIKYIPFLTQRRWCHAHRMLSARYLAATTRPRVSFVSAKHRQILALISALVYVHRLTSNCNLMTISSNRRENTRWPYLRCRAVRECNVATNLFLLLLLLFIGYRRFWYDFFTILMQRMMFYVQFR